MKENGDANAEIFSWAVPAAENIRQHEQAFVAIASPLDNTLHLHRKL